jgi:hypothetical protein
MHFRVCAAALIAASVICAAPASAELVFLTSGRTLSVKGYHQDGETVVLMLRGGGEVTCDRSLIERIEPDEVPYPEPEPPRDENQPLLPSSRLDAVPYGELIDSLAAAHGVDPYLVKALIQVESGYRPGARSNKGAMGLMQLMPSTARQYRVRNPFDPRANIEAGIKHLKALLGRFDSVSLALAAYNAGEGAVQRFGGIPPYRETRSYVSKILSLVTPSK